jgi:hypothetical protein
MKNSGCDVYLAYFQSEKKRFVQGEMCILYL